MSEKELTQEELEKAAGGLRTSKPNQQPKPTSAAAIQGADGRGSRVKPVE